MALLISANVIVIRSFNRYPLILLSLASSLQEAKAASLILLAQIWRSERDRVNAVSKAVHRGHRSARMREGPRGPDRGDDVIDPTGRVRNPDKREQRRHLSGCHDLSNQVFCGFRGTQPEQGHPARGWSPSGRGLADPSTFRVAAPATILATPVARTAATTGMSDPSVLSRSVGGTGAGARTLSMVRSSG